MQGFSENTARAHSNISQDIWAHNELLPDLIVQYPPGTKAAGQGTPY